LILEKLKKNINIIIDDLGQGVDLGKATKLGVILRGGLNLHIKYLPISNFKSLLQIYNYCIYTPCSIIIIVQNFANERVQIFVYSMRFMFLYVNDSNQ